MPEIYCKTICHQLHNAIIQHPLMAATSTMTVAPPTATSQPTTATKNTPLPTIASGATDTTAPLAKPVTKRKKLAEMPLWKLKEASQPVDLSSITVEGLGKMELKRAISQHRGEYHNTYLMWLTQEKQIELDPNVPEHIHVANSLAYDNATRLDQTIHDLERQLRHMCENKDKFKSKVTIPPDSGIDHEIDYKDAKTVIPKYDHTHPTVKFEEFFEKTFEFGQNQEYSHSDFVRLLSQFLQGDMYQAFRTMKKENLTYIVRSLEDEFAKSETLTDHKQQVAAFSRKPGEPIRSCLSRFRRILEKTQTRMSTSRAKERTISKLEQLLFTVASPSALIKLKEAERNSEANGYELSWTTMLKIVEEQEDIAQDVPQEAKPLSIHVHEVTTRIPRGPSPKTHNMSTGRLRTQSRSPSPAGRYSTAAGGAYASDQNRTIERDITNPVRDKRPRFDDNTEKPKEHTRFYTTGRGNETSRTFGGFLTTKERSSGFKKRDEKRAMQELEQIKEQPRPFLQASRGNSPARQQYYSSPSQNNAPQNNQYQGYTQGFTPNTSPQGAKGPSNQKVENVSYNTQPYQRGRSQERASAANNAYPASPAYPQAAAFSPPDMSQMLWPMAVANMFPQGAFTQAIFPNMVSPQGMFPTGVAAIAPRATTPVQKAPPRASSVDRRPNNTNNTNNDNYTKKPPQKRGMNGGQCWGCGSTDPNHQYFICWKEFQKKNAQAKPVPTQIYNNTGNPPPEPQICRKCGSGHRHTFATCQGPMAPDNLKE